MRVMPSVTETIEPTLRASVTDLKFSIRCLIRSLISVALMAMCFLFPVEFVMPLGGQFVSDARELAAERAVDDQVARREDGAADQLRVDGAVQPHLAPQALLERAGDLA